MSKKVSNKIKLNKSSLVYCLVVALISCFTIAGTAFGMDFGTQGNQMFNDVKNLIGGVLVTAGAAIGIYGGIRAGLSFRDHNGPGVTDGLMTVFGGLVMAGGGVLFMGLTVTV